MRRYLILVVAVLVAAAAGMPARDGAVNLAAPAEQGREYRMTVDHMEKVFRKFGISIQHHLMLHWYLEDEARRNGSLDPNRHHLEPYKYTRANKRVWSGIGRMTAKDIRGMMPDAKKQVADAGAAQDLDKEFDKNEAKALKLKMSINRCQSCQSWQACYGPCKTELDSLTKDLAPEEDQAPAMMTSALALTRQRLQKCLAELASCNAQEDLGEGASISTRERAHRRSKYPLWPRAYGKGNSMTAGDEEKEITNTPNPIEKEQKQQAKELYVKRTARQEEADRKKYDVIHQTTSVPDGLMKDVEKLSKQAKKFDQQEKDMYDTKVRIKNAVAINAQASYVLAKAMYPKKKQELKDAATAEDPQKALGVTQKSLMQCYLDRNGHCGKGAGFSAPPRL